MDSTLVLLVYDLAAGRDKGAGSRANTSHVHSHSYSPCASPVYGSFSVTASPTPNNIGDAGLSALLDDSLNLRSSGGAVERNFYDSRAHLAPPVINSRGVARALRSLALCLLAIDFLTNGTPRLSASAIRRNFSLERKRLDRSE